MVNDKTILRFILVLPRIPEIGQFRLKDLPGSGGRVDILCRSLAACFDWGPATWPLSRLELVAVVGEDATLRFESPADALPRGETHWARVISSVLEGKALASVSRERKTLDELLRDILSSPNEQVWALEESGEPLEMCTDLDPRGKNSFMLGDHRGFDSAAIRAIDDHSIYRLTLGNTSYPTSHCVAAIISRFEGLVNDDAGR
ncbi:MAG: hypothetical protein ACFFD9_05875 [Candidatus Thorarchaeota archaeon]